MYMYVYFNNDTWTWGLVLVNLSQVYHWTTQKVTDVPEQNPIHDVTTLQSMEPKPKQMKLQLCWKQLPKIYRNNTIL